MTGNFPSWEWNTQEFKNDSKPPAIINAHDMPYWKLNQKLRELAGQGYRYLTVNGVRGQRYLGTRLSFPDLMLQVNGTPGEDLAFNLDGPTVEVFGHGQNAAANTMDRGKLIIHGLAGDALAYGMRGGKVFVRDDVGYRVGIHMKEYGEKKPVLVIGGTSGDYLGEYMAGGTIILLNRHQHQWGATGRAENTLATGIHGGEIFVYGSDIPPSHLGIGANLQEVTPEEVARVEEICREFCNDFGLEAKPLLKRPLYKVSPKGSRPFASFYVPAYPVNTGLRPEPQEGGSPCQVACPAGIPTGHFLKYLRRGEREKALRLLEGYTPLRFSCCGFICPHPCMEECTRGQVDFPVRTEELAHHYTSDNPCEITETPLEKIAIIGAGPAGLSAAYQLRLKGYQVEIFDEANYPGGKLYQVIPRYRLPLEALKHDLLRMEKMGIGFSLGTRVDKIFMNQLLVDYDYLVVATGAHQGVVPSVPGSESIVPGLDFLKDYGKGRFNSSENRAGLSGPLVIIGGGKAALEGIEVILSLGVDGGNITVVCRSFPRIKKDQRKALELNGVTFRYPVRILEANEAGLLVINHAGERELLPGEQVMAFIKEQPSGWDFLPAEVEGCFDENGFFLPPSAGSYRTGHPKISITGDAMGQGLVAENIKRGRECAQEVDAVLKGLPYIKEKVESPDYSHLSPHKAVPWEDPDLEEEAYRCLHCGICVQCDECVENCPRGALYRKEEELQVDLTRCGGCGTCAATCLGGVIRMVPR